MGRGRPNRAGARKRAARDRAREGRRVRHPRSQPHRVGALRLRARTDRSGRGSDLPVEHAGRVRVRPRARERGRLPRRRATCARRSTASSSSTSTSASASTSSVRWAASTPSKNPGAVERAREQIGDDDLFTLIYTSGTTGPPKGCMILNRNYYDMVGTVDEIETFFLPTDVMLLYLPLAHNFGRLMHLLGAHLGFTIAFLADPRRIGEVMPQVRPTILPTVPRVLEKVHTAVSANFAATTGVKRRLVDWALGVGTEVSELRQRREPVPERPRLEAPHRRPARLLEGEGAARRTAARCDLGRRAAGEGDRRVLPRARTSWSSRATARPRRRAQRPSTGPRTTSSGPWGLRSPASS